MKIKAEIIPLKFKFDLAHRERIEPSLTGLEAVVLPLNDRRMY